MISGPTRGPEDLNHRRGVADSTRLQIHPT